jgi:Na+/proline symporter
MTSSLHPLDLAVLLAYLGFALAVGLASREEAGQDTESYFLAGRSTPWWWAGISIAATTFAADTPLAVTGIIASRGLGGNWLWLSWIGVHAAVVVVFAGCWSRLGVVTDAELLARRYSGRLAGWLRGLRAGLSGVVLNVITLGWVLKAMRAIATPFFPWREWAPGMIAALEAVWPAGGAMGSAEEALTVLVLLAVAATYSSLGGLRGVMKTDLVQFALALVGSALFASVAWSEVGGRAGLVAGLTRLYGPGHEYLTLWPSSGAGWVEALGMGPVMLGAYLVVQSSPADARKAMGLFVFIQYLLRVWPWFLVGLAALVLIPIGAEATALGGAGAAVAGDRQLAYPVLLAQLLGPGLKGLLVTSLLAAFMSTVDTHLNWGASYVVQDVYLRWRPDADAAAQVRVGRLAVLGFVVAAVLVSFRIGAIADAWRAVGSFGAALGIPTILRWLWWRVNASAELGGMVLGLLAAGALATAGSHTYEARLVLTAGASLIGVVAGAFLGPRTDPEVVMSFAEQVRPPGFWPGRPTLDAAWQLAACTTRVAAIVVAVGLGLEGGHRLLLSGGYLDAAAFLAAAIALGSWGGQGND